MEETKAAGEMSTSQLDEKREQEVKALQKVIDEAKKAALDHTKEKNEVEREWMKKLSEAKAKAVEEHKVCMLFARPFCFLPCVCFMERGFSALPCSKPYYSTYELSREVGNARLRTPSADGGCCGGRREGYSGKGTVRKD